MGNPFGETGLNGFIADAEGVNDLGVGIGEKGNRELLALGEVGQRGRGVIAEGGDAVAEFADGIGMDSQFDQLGFAVRSPIGGTEEEQPGTVRAGEGREGTRSARLIDGGEGWHRRPDCGAVALGERAGVSLREER